jgi:hypothetical protein
MRPRSDPCGIALTTNKSDRALPDAVLSHPIVKLSLQIDGRVVQTAMQQQKQLFEY